MKQNYKKSILGLNTVKAFIIVLLVIAIISIVTLVILGAITSPTFVQNTGATISGTNVNETLTKVNETAQSLTVSTQIGDSCTIIQAVNASNGYVISSTNYTTANGACTIALNSSQPTFNNTLWKVTYSFTYKDPSTTYITSNVSSGLLGFFSSSTTFFALLAVVVIILIISLVVVVVNRFGGEGTGITQEANL